MGYGNTGDHDDLGSSVQRQLRLVGADRRVLELGCAIGAMTVELKKRRCTVVGIERDPESARIAATIADEVLVADLDEADLSALVGAEPFDVVLMGDVLEHLREPARVVRQALEVLAPGGHAVVSVPNVAHGGVRLALAQGRFPYADDGLLDRTHIHFFTPATIVELLEDVGWEVLRVEHVHRDPLDTEIALDHGAVDPRLLELVRADPVASTYQVVVAAKPAGALHPVELPGDPLVSAVAATARRSDVLPPARSGPVAGVRAFAFYLPQFHPIPENDVWWGKGFTEWTNVTRATPRFHGHRQPNLPSDLGFYDLRVPQTRVDQARLAAEHGIEGFVYYHYWFAGRRLLDGPLEAALRSGEPDFPFAVLWANESWSRRWDGRELDLLVEQTYPEGDIERHAAYLAELFADPRYIRVDGAPLFILYRVDTLPGGARAYVDRLREALEREGVGAVHLVRAETGPHDGDPASFGCDAEVEFHPHRLHLLAARAADRFGQFDRATAYEYVDVAEGHLRRPRAPWTRYPCVVPHWDNTPRRELRDSMFLLGSDPELYERWLRGVAEREAGPGGTGMVFINAWNEWAEGAYLEPDQRFGRGYLEATRRVLGTRPAVAPATGSAEWQVRDLAALVEELQREVADAYERGQALARAEIERLEAALAEVSHDWSTRGRMIEEVSAWAKDQQVARAAAEQHYRNLETAYLDLKRAYEELHRPTG